MSAAIKKPKLTLSDLNSPEAKRKLALDVDREARASVRYEEALKVEVPIAPRPKDVGVYGSGLPYRPPETPGQFWVHLKAHKQWLKLISDTRPNRPHKLLRVELWDENRKEKKASFYRR